MKDRNIFAKMDRDTLCFLVTAMILGGVGIMVHSVAMNTQKKPAKKENIMNVIQAQRDTQKVRAINIMDLISTKQK